MLKQILKKRVVFAAALVGLTGCLSTPNIEPHRGLSNAHTDTSVQSYAVKGAEQFTGRHFSQYGFENGHPTDQTYYFDFDSHRVKSGDMENITVQTAYLQQHPELNILLEGHTDSCGSREYNIALGERRAIAVRDIVEFNGVPKKQIRWVSYGQEKPVASSVGNSECREPLNRRVHLVYLYPKGFKM